MSFFSTLCEMLVILFAMAMGFLAHRLGYFNGETDQRLSKVVLNITMPAMIVAAVITGDTLPELAEVLAVLKVAAVFYLLEMVFALAAPRLLGGTPGQKGVWRFGLVFGNIAFIGYPVATALFGPEALFYAVILAMPFNLLSYPLHHRRRSGPLLRPDPPPASGPSGGVPCLCGKCDGAAVAAGGRLLAGGTSHGSGVQIPPAVVLFCSAAAGAARGAVYHPPGPEDRVPSAGDHCHRDGHARGRQRQHAVPGVRRGQGVHGPGDPSDHGGLHHHHSADRLGTAVRPAGEGKPWGNGPPRAPAPAGKCVPLCHPPLL